MKEQITQQGIYRVRVWSSKDGTIGFQKTSSKNGYWER